MLCRNSYEAHGLRTTFPCSTFNAGTLYFDLGPQVVRIVLDSDLETFIASCDLPSVLGSEKNSVVRNGRLRTKGSIVPR